MSNIERHAHVSRREARALLFLAAGCQVAMAFGLYQSEHFPIVWGSWFALSAVAAFIAGMWPESRTALKVSAVGVVVGCAGRCLSVLYWYKWASMPTAVGLARAAIYALAAGMAFIVWVGVLAPCNGVMRAEKRLDAGR